jgi:RNA polymerase sigma-54 factor
MALSQRLEFRQSQALVMTPQLMQAIKLLQLSSLDLAAYVENELEKNPLLERGASEQDARGAEPPPEQAPSGDATPADWAGEEMQTSRSAMEEGLGTELENVFPDDSAGKQPSAEAPQPS